MRMRNKPWVSGYLEEDHQYLIKEPASYKGQWKNLFKKDVLNVEIGCGKGDYWLTMAEKHPDEAWLAIEKERNCAALALKKAEEKKLDNVYLLITDATDVDLIFASQEIDRIYLNFSDPWPKKHYSKRRLTSGSFIEKYAEVLKDDGTLTFKTDNQKLFEFTLVSMNLNWLLQDVCLDFDSEANDDALTEYERRFKAEGVAIKRAVFGKRISK